MAAYRLCWRGGQKFTCKHGQCPLKPHTNFMCHWVNILGLEIWRHHSPQKPFPDMTVCQLGIWPGIPRHCYDCKEEREQGTYYGSSHCGWLIHIIRKSEHQVLLSCLDGLSDHPLFSWGSHSNTTHPVLTINRPYLHRSVRPSPILPYWYKIVWAI